MNRVSRMDFQNLCGPRWATAKSPGKGILANTGRTRSGAARTAMIPGACRAGSVRTGMPASRSAFAAKRPLRRSAGSACSMMVQRVSAEQCGRRGDPGHGLVTARAWRCRPAADVWGAGWGHGRAVPGLGACHQAAEFARAR